MPLFDYAALDRSGKNLKGTLTAESERQARRALREKDLFPEWVKLARDKQSAEGKQSDGRSGAMGSKRLSQFQLAMVLRQVGVLINSGLPLEQALKMTSEQAESSRERRLCEAWRAEITEGRSFSGAMKRAPYRIPESVIASVGVGEETGHLHQVLMRMADEIESGDQNRKTFTRGLIYPAILVLASVIVTIVMMTVVVPSLTEVFRNQDLQLPLVTRVVMSLSQFTLNYGLWLGLLILASAVAFALALKKPRLRLAWHRQILKLPLAGRWMRMADISDWSRSLGTLLGSGVPALSALGISSTLVKNLELRQRFEAVTESMRRGSSLHASLREAELDAGFLVHMVGSGEASSELSQMLTRVGDYYRNRLEVAVDTFLKLMNPVLIILIGGIILTVVMSIMLPILELTEQVN